MTDHSMRKCWGTDYSGGRIKILCGFQCFQSEKILKQPEAACQDIPEEKTGALSFFAFIFSADAILIVKVRQTNSLGGHLKNTIDGVLRLFSIFTLLIAGTFCSGPETVVNDGFGDYLRVEGGEFLMGDNFDEGNSDEIPVHSVILDTYYIGKHKVTNLEYAKFIKAGGYAEPEYWKAGGFEEYGRAPAHWDDAVHKGGSIPGNENYPVIGVSWFEAAAYCRWLSSETGWTYRLPTEAEWERAARGTDQRRYAWGNEIDKSRANYDYGMERKDMELKPAGAYDGSIRNGLQTRDNAAPCGAYDMTGNTFEWCADFYGRTYYSESPTMNPRGPQTGTSRVLRSAGYIDSAYYQRAASRHKRGPHVKSHATGFRCVREDPAVRDDR